MEKLMINIKVYYELRGELITSMYSFPEFSQEVLDTIKIELYQFKDYKNYKLIVESNNG
jgi:hypothetical protein